MNVEGLPVAVVGSGTMGPGIAQVFAQAGCSVRLVDIDSQALVTALAKIKANIVGLVEYGVIGEDDAGNILTKIETSTDLKGSISDVEYVVEAVTEDLGLKNKIFQILDENTPANAILSSNTSGLSIDEIAAVTRRADKVIGTNWWNPPHITPLIEIMKAKATSDETVAYTRDLLMSLGKKPVVILKPIQGFLGNRLQTALLREALSLLEKNVASKEDIDTAVKYGPGFRWLALGPFEVVDFGGVDIYYGLTEHLNSDLDRSTDPSKTLGNLVRRKELGVKSGRGIYDYRGVDMEDLTKDRDSKLLKVLKLQREMS